MSNAAWRNFAYHQRIEFALDDLEPAIPNRRMLRDSLRYQAPRALRRAVFGAWRNRGR